MYRTSTTTQNATQNHHTPCHPNDTVRPPAMKNRSVWEHIIHEPQRPMGRPRFSAGNHMDMTAGPTPAIMPPPPPSSTRVAMSTHRSVANAPMTPPTAAQASEITPIFFGPILRMSAAAGMAVIMPMMVNTDVSQPASVSPMLKYIITTSMQGGTLFWTLARAKPPKKAMMTTVHAAAVFCFLVNPTPPYSDSPRLLTKPVSETRLDSNGCRDDSSSTFPPDKLHTRSLGRSLFSPNQRRLVIIDARTVPLSCGKYRQVTRLRVRKGRRKLHGTGVTI